MTALKARRPARIKGAPASIPEELLARQLELAGIAHERQWKLRARHKSRTGRAVSWRFDFGFPEHSLAVEVDGGIWIRGAHSHPLAIERSMLKGNDATFAGVAVLRFTPKQVYSREAVSQIQRFMAAQSTFGA